jgi:hypothetical protein
MSIAKREPFTGFRNDPLRETLEVIGVNLTGGLARFCIRQRPDQEGDALLEVEGEDFIEDDEPLVSGIRLIEVTEDEDGVFTSILEITSTKEEMQALPAASEQGRDLTLYYDFEWQVSEEEAAPFAAAEETILYGDFIVRGSANG